jgi:hypothetical protein
VNANKLKTKHPGKPAKRRRKEDVWAPVVIDFLVLRGQDTGYAPGVGTIIMRRKVVLMKSNSGTNKKGVSHG